MKKLLLGLMLLGFSAHCAARQMTTLKIINQTGVDWKVKVESGGKWITEWTTAPANALALINNIDAETFTAQLRSVPIFKITATVSKDIVFFKKFDNGSTSLTIKQTITDKPVKEIPGKSKSVYDKDHSCYINYSIE